jgi:hypothetical protein
VALPVGYYRSGGHVFDAEGRRVFLPIAGGAPLDPTHVRSGGRVLDPDGREVIVADGAALGGASADSTIPIKPTGFNNDAAVSFPATGLLPGRTRIRIPDRERVFARFHTAASLSPANPAGVSADVAPDHPSGAITVTAANFAERTAVQVVSPTVDISNKIVRVPCKISSTDWTKVQRILVEVTSAVGGTDFTNGANVKIIPGSGTSTTVYQLRDLYQNFAVGPSEWSPFGAGADLTAITGIRVRINHNSSAGSSSISLSHAETVPLYGNAEGKATLILCFDDWYASHWTTVLQKFEQYGFPGNLVPNLAQPQDFEVRDQIRHMVERYGWQVWSHAWTNSSHNTIPTGDAFTAEHAAVRQRAAALALPGGEDFAWYGNLSPNVDHYERLRQFYRTGRLFVGDRPPLRTETMPPMEPLRMVGYGMGAADSADSGALMIAYINKAIAQKGLAIITWHNTYGAELDAVLAHADANRATLDVMTLEQALRPWIVER